MKRYVNRVALACMLMSLGSLLGCSDDTETAIEAPKLRVNLFGWGPDDQGSLGFVEGLPDYAGATKIQAKMTNPVDGRVISQSEGAVGSRALKVPAIEYGEDLRLELEVVSDNGVVLASGATPTFNFSRDTDAKALRLMVSPTNDFSPVGTIFQDSGAVKSVLDTNAAYILNNFQTEDLWIGRVGHAAATTSDGKVLIVGGAYVTQTYRPNAVPNFRAVYNDVQVYDPKTGYFSDISYDETAQDLRPGGADRLVDGRAFHTLTPIGNDRFIVSGGYLSFDGETRPVRTLELIDLKAEPGSRVAPVVDTDGDLIQTLDFRAMHQTVYLRERGLLVLVGGLGRQTEDVLPSIEVVDLANQTLLNQAPMMEQARVGHRVVALEDGTIWVIGGRNASGALASTEIITVSDLGGVSVSAGPNLLEARYDMGITGIESKDGTRVLVAGGYTGDGDQVLSSLEIGGAEIPTFLSAGAMARARGGLDLVRLPQTGDVMVFGGYDASQAVVAQAERLSFKGFQTVPPFEVISDGVGSLKTPRYGATYSLMTSGQIMAVGGVARVSVGANQTDLLSLDDAEVYNARDPVGLEN